MLTRREMFGAIPLLFVCPSVLSAAGKLHEYEPVIWGKTPPRSLVLTFDDGPRTWVTPHILDFLKTEHIPATFFVLGQNINLAAARNTTEREEFRKNRELLLRAHREGHRVGNHTYGHTDIFEWLQKKGKQWILQDIEKAERLLHDLLGYRPRFFRPRSWNIHVKYPTGWKLHNTAPKNLCDVYWEEQARPAEEHLVYPDIELYAEELICRGYIVQKRDDPLVFQRLLEEYLQDPRWKKFYQSSPKVVERIVAERAAGIREVQDVDTEDWRYHELSQQDPDGAVLKLTRGVRAYLAGRERAGILTHVLTFHEREVSLAALKILVPEWKAANYQFRSLSNVWGI